MGAHTTRRHMGKVDEAIQQRGPGTTRITKVKGHATEHHIIDGITKEHK